MIPFTSPLGTSLKSLFSPAIFSGQGPIAEGCASKWYVSDCFHSLDHERLPDWNYFLAKSTFSFTSLLEVSLKSVILALFSGQVPISEGCTSQLLFVPDFFLFPENERLLDTQTTLTNRRVRINIHMIMLLQPVFTGIFLGVQWKLFCWTWRRKHIVK